MPRGPEQEPKATQIKDEVRFEHPAFGQIQASRVSGTTTLHGTDFLHHNFISVRIHHSELIRNLSHEWNFPRAEYIEILMSEAQWATFVSSLNVGTGTPCTIHHLNGESVPSIPFRQQEDSFRAEIKKDLAELVELVEGTMQDVEGELGSTLSAKKRYAILEKLRKLKQEVKSNIPFVAEQFEKHMENTVEHAKTEVHGYISGVVARAGLAEIAAQRVLQLGPGETDDKT